MISVILPAYNEGLTIGAVIKEIFSYVSADIEVLVVDDGSRDNTSEAAKAAGACVLRLEKNLGKGMALRKGIRQAKGSVLVFMDGDGQDPAEEIPKLIEEIRKGADFVNGSKFLGRCESGAISSLNRAGNQFMNGIINFLFKTKITDSQSGFRAISAAALSMFSGSLSAKEYEIETEMLLRAMSAGLNIVEIPVVRRKRAEGHSHLRRVKHGLRILKVILKQWADLKFFR